MSKTFHTILVPVDYSPYSTEALLYAASIATQFSSSLLVLQVIAKEIETIAAHQRSGRHGLPPHVLGPFSESLEMPGEEVSVVEVDLREQAQSALQHFLPEALSGLPVELRVAIGHPFEQIIEIAQNEQMDLIVMGTHGRTGLAHLVMGSVAERVVRMAPCPVMTVKAPASATS